MSYKNNSIELRNPLVVLEMNALEEMLSALIKETFATMLGSASNQKQTNTFDDECLLSVNDVVKILNVSKMTIHNWKKKGIIKSYKMGRRLYFKRSEITEAIKHQKYSL